jgi:hypothetical protein
VGLLKSTNHISTVAHTDQVVNRNSQNSKIRAPMFLQVLGSMVPVPPNYAEVADAAATSRIVVEIMIEVV